MSLALINQSMMAFAGMNNNAFKIQQANHQRMALANISPQTAMMHAANPFSQEYTAWVTKLNRADTAHMLEALNAQTQYAANAKIAEGYKKAKEAYAKTFSTFA